MEFILPAVQSINERILEIIVLNSPEAEDKRMWCMAIAIVFDCSVCFLKT